MAPTTKSISNGFLFRLLFRMFTRHTEVPLKRVEESLTVVGINLTY